MSDIIVNEALVTDENDLSWLPQFKADLVYAMSKVPEGRVVASSDVKAVGGKFFVRWTIRPKAADDF